jgi:hypothetical protein
MVVSETLTKRRDFLTKRRETLIMLLSETLSETIIKCRET